MSDPMTPDVRDWIKHTDANPPDPQRSASQVMARLPEVRQHSRWWPLPVRYQKPQATHLSTVPTEYQPASTPASGDHGHGPIVTGRTHSMFSPVKAITAGALVFALGGVLFITQPFGQQEANVPGAATETVPAEAVEFTARYPWGPQLSAGTTEELANGVTEDVGLAWRTTGTASDERFAGTMVYTCNVHLYPAEQGRLNDCVYRIENSDGAWQSRPAVELDFGDSSYGPFGTRTTVFDGQDAFEGSTAIVEVTEGAFEGYTLHGLIVNADLPLDPEPYQAP